MGKYVLVVDDDPSVRCMLCDALAIVGVEGRTAVNGLEALELIEQQPPALIILDIMMPGLDGFSTLARMQKRIKSRAIPVILLSGLVDGRRSRMWLPSVIEVIGKSEFSIPQFLALLEKAGISPQIKPPEKQEKPQSIQVAPFSHLPSGLPRHRM